MSWNKWFNEMQSSVPVLFEIANKQILKAFINEGGHTQISADTAVLRQNPRFFPLIEGVMDQGPSMIAQVYLLGKVISDGPKIFRPELSLVEALEDVEINVALKDWCQPFETMIVEFPKEFSSRHLHVKCPQAGETLSDTQYGFSAVIPDAHTVDYVVVHHQADINMLGLAVQMSSGQVMVRLLTGKDKDATIEDLMDLTMRVDKTMPLSVETSDEEKIVGSRACLAALNATQYLMEFGCKSEPSNPKHEERLKHFLRVAYRDKKDQAKIAQAKANLKGHPYILRPEKTVTLYEEARDHTKSVATGRELGPHIRRGHYQHYWVGSGADRKKVRKMKQPQRINFHLLAPGQSQTVIYRTESDKI